MVAYRQPVLLDVNVFDNDEAGDGVETSPALNNTAEWKMESMLVTLTVFQLATFWLNAAAPLNVLAMLATDTVFQPEMFTLKADADRNICEQTTGYRA
jgi:hypothetical protein